MLAYLFVIFAVAVRFLPHPFAFTPVGASLLFFGARGPRRQMWVPLAVLAASDVLLTTLVYRYPAHLGSLRNLVLVRRDVMARHRPSPERRRPQDPGFCRGWLNCIFPGKQLRGLGRLERFISDDFCGIDDLL